MVPDAGDSAELGQVLNKQQAQVQEESGGRGFEPHSVICWQMCFIYLSPGPLSVNGAPLRVQGDVVWSKQAALRECKPLVSLGLDPSHYKATGCYRGEAEAGREDPAGSVV